MITQKSKITLVLLSALSLFILTDPVIAKSELIIKNETKFDIKATNLGLIQQKDIPCDIVTRCFYSHTPSSTPIINIPHESTFTPTPSWDFYIPTTLTLTVVGDTKQIKDLNSNKTNTLTFSNPEYETTLDITTKIKDIPKDAQEIYKHPEMKDYKSITVTIKMVSAKHIEALKPLGETIPEKTERQKLPKLRSEGISDVFISNRTKYPIRITLEDQNRGQKSVELDSYRENNIRSNGTNKYAFDGATFYFVAIKTKEYDSKIGTIHWNDMGMDVGGPYFFNTNEGEPIKFYLKFFYNTQQNEVHIEAHEDTLTFKTW